MGDEPKRISERIEDAVEGILRFASRFLWTFWTILRHPVACGERLLAPDTEPPSYTRPYTFLAIGGFFFTLTLSAFPHGLVGLIDIIWFDDDISATLRDRSAEILTLTGLLLAAIPVLLTVPALSHLYARMLVPKDARADFGRLAAYVFGYQALMAFSLFYLALAGSILEHFVVLPAGEAGEGLAAALLLVVALLTLLALATPATALRSFQRRHRGSDGRLARTIRGAAVALFALLTFTTMTYTASIPGAARIVLADTPDSVEMTYIDDPRFLVTEHGNGTAEVTFELSLVIDNTRAQSLVVPESAVEIMLVREPEIGESEEVRAELTELRWNDNPAGAIRLPRQQLGAFTFTGRRELEEDHVRSLAGKLYGGEEANDYDWFIIVELRDDSEKFRRTLALTQSYVTWTGASAPRRQ